MSEESANQRVLRAAVKQIAKSEPKPSTIPIDPEGVPNYRKLAVELVETVLGLDTRGRVTHTGWDMAAEFLREKFAPTTHTIDPKCAEPAESDNALADSFAKLTGSYGEIHSAALRLIAQVRAESRTIDPETLREVREALERINDRLDWISKKSCAKASSFTTSTVAGHRDQSRPYRRIASQADLGLSDLRTALAKLPNPEER